MLKYYQNRISEGCQMLAEHIKATAFATGMLATIFILPATVAATYYVSDIAGSNSYSAAQAQSINTPWKTIQRAASNMVAGDTCLIMNGIYRETVVPPSSGTTVLPITFQGYNDDNVIINGADTLPVSGQAWTPESAKIYYTPIGLDIKWLKSGIAKRCNDS